MENDKKKKFPGKASLAKYNFGRGEGHGPLAHLCPGGGGLDINSPKERRNA